MSDVKANLEALVTQLHNAANVGMNAMRQRWIDENRAAQYEATEALRAALRALEGEGGGGVRIETIEQTSGLLFVAFTEGFKVCIRSDVAEGGAFWRWQVMSGAQTTRAWSGAGRAVTFKAALEQVTARARLGASA